MKFLTAVGTAFALGLPNLTRVAVYRLSLKLGLNPVLRLRAVVPLSPFFHHTSITKQLPLAPGSNWAKSGRLFSYWPIAVTDQPPDWLANPFTGVRTPTAQLDWWRIRDFDPTVGDIKLLWELSRFDWVVAFAQRAAQGDRQALCLLNSWLQDWCVKNPPYQGPNWKCGQEASIRVIHLAMAAMILDQVKTAAVGLHDLLGVHLQRIAPTVNYARAQDNNHGTSEAAALFIGGSWLALLGDEKGIRWQKTGRRLLEERVARLIGPQGSFSQYSLNYHRLMLDTLCLAEVWRRSLVLPEFSACWQERAFAATQWLYHMVNPVSGYGPNVGANDGANLLQLTESSYRDFRPSIQLAMALFCHTRAYSIEGLWDDCLRWLRVPLPPTAAAPPLHLVDNDGGFVVMRRGLVMVMFRYPRFRFRPSQSDALHLDLWLSSENLLRDAGSFSYNTEQRWLNYFGGTAGHNTVEFDERDQMPRLSRFLFGEWLETSFLESLDEDDDSVRYAAGYRDSQGATHWRRVRLADAHLTVADEVRGFSHKAVLRWRMMPGSWQLGGLPDAPYLTCPGSPSRALKVYATVPIIRCELVEGWDSNYYMEKSRVPVLEVEVEQAGTLVTEVHWEV